MPSVYDLKPRFQNVLRPLVGRLAEAGVRANAVTIAAMFLSAGCGAFLLATQSRMALLLLGPVLLVRMAFNAMDGMLARDHDQASLLGAKLNEIGDVVSDCCLYLPLAVLLAPGWPIVLAVVAGVLTEFAGVVALATEGRRRYDGPFSKSDRAVLFALIAALAAFVAMPATAIIVIFLLATAGGVITICNRLFRGADHV